jgi:hypothetical protein
MAKDKNKSSGFKTTLTQARDTKNTFVFKNDADDAPIPSLYIAKSAFAGEAPKQITVSVDPA